MKSKFPSCPVMCSSPKDAEQAMTLRPDLKKSDLLTSSNKQDGVPENSSLPMRSFNRTPSKPTTTTATTRAATVDPTPDSEEVGGEINPTPNKVTSSTRAPAEKTSDDDTADPETPAPTTPTAKADPAPTSSSPAPQTTPAKKPSTGSGTGDDQAGSDTSTSDGESKALAACRQLKADADQACTYSGSSMSADDSSGVSQTCEDMRSKGLKDAKSKDTAARACTVSFTTCFDGCNGSATKYSDGDYPATFTSLAYACQALSAKAQEISDGSGTSLSASNNGLSCTENTAESTQSAGGAGGQAPQSVAKDAAKEAAVTCAANPTSPECAAKTQYAAALASTAGFNQVDASKAPLDVGDTSGLNVNPGVGGGEAGTPGAAIKNGTVANNTGGGIPGAGGGGGAAGGGKGGIAGALSAAASSVADIEKGLLGGGYSQLLSGQNPYSDAPPTEEEVYRALAALGVPRPAKIDPDLKRYLPGGDLAGQGNLMSTTQSQFHSKGVDLFSRIHDRYEVKCRLGELYDCR